MNTKTLIAGTIALTLLGVTIVPRTAIAAPALTEESRLGTNGIGPVIVGMTVKQAEAASGRTFKWDNSSGDICTYASPNGIKGLSFMVIRGVIERVNITNPKMFTLSGAKIGDTEARIKQLYPGQIKVTPHPYTGGRGGKYLTFYPKDQQDKQYRLIFETRNGKVTFFRGGYSGAVEAIEGCA
jgi:hypothetical protein